MTAQYSGDANYAAVPESACIDDEEDVLVTPKPLTLTTDVTPDEIVLGNTFTDRATLAGVPTGAAFPAPGGTMTFRVYKGDVCNATTRVFGPDVVTVSGVNTDSPTYRPLSAGTYRVTAQYSGDANYAAVPESACIDDEEDVLVTPKPLTLTTDVTPDQIALGNTFTDRATLVGVPTGAAFAAPGGTMTFRVYKGDSCNASTLVFGPDVVTVSGVNTDSPTYRPLSTGTYRVTAQYSGDANYGAVPESACIDDEEDVLVTPRPLTLTTDVTPDEMVLGNTFTDRATLTGVPTGAAFPAPGGTMIFRVYKGGTCDASTLVFGPDAVTVSGVNTDSPTYRPLSTGTYRVTAQYSGDANYAAVPESACIDAEEDVIVTLGAPDIDTQVSHPARAVGQSFTDTATVTGSGPLPTGTVTFAFFAPGDTNCQSPLTNLTPPQTEKTLTGNPRRATSEPFTVQMVGQYRVIATYSGDTNYAGISGACGEGGENVAVTLPPDIGVTKSVTPASQPLPSGQFTFTIRVSNPGPERIRILTLTDDVYGNIANTSGTGPNGSTFANSTCGTLIGTELDPGEQSAPCTFIGTFTRQTPGTETDTVTVGGVGITSGIPVTDTAQAIVALVPRVPQIAVVKDASPASQPVPGGPFTFTVRVSNPGNVPIIITSLTDDIYGNIANASGTGPNGSTFTDSTCGALIGTTLAPGAQSDPCSFKGTFTSATPGSQTDVVTVVGRDEIVPPGGPTVTAHDDARVELTPVTPPPPPPPPPVAPPPPPPPPVQDVAPVSDVPRGAATISGKTGCQGTPFNVMVAGRQIEKVIFSLDGKVLKTLTRPNSGSRYKLPVNPRTKKTGIHRVLARIIFTKASGTNNRTLRVLFTRCGRKTNLPAFTG